MMNKHKDNMKHLDFTIDYETVGLTANAAPMQVAIVPWRRDAEKDPFFGMPEPFVMSVDLRTCVVDGFEFDPETVKWWTERSDVAKQNVCRGKATPAADVLFASLLFLRETVKTMGTDSICLWCQGEDVDIAILRNLCKKYGARLDDYVPHTSFRDCRTVILEAALIEAERSVEGKSTRANGIALPHQIQTNPSLAYKLFDPLPEQYTEGIVHDAKHDAIRSSWNTWQALRWLRGC